ncbi:MAG: Sua5/YciO/YrdC/YwlC family protein, partial [Lysobacterales bacterium]
MSPDPARSGLTGDLAQAVAVLRAGGLVLHPTEAVWGLSCDPHNAQAVAAVMALKQRPGSKGLILVAANFQALAPLLAPIPESCRQLACASWPGPHTWVWPAAENAPAWLVGERGSLAVRISAHPALAALAAAFGGAL